MSKQILWIEDDYYHIQALFRPIEKQGYTIDYALSAGEGIEKAKKWKKYQFIVVDIILPLHKPNQILPEFAKSWGSQECPGIGLVKWLLEDQKVTCPVIVLSVIDDLLEKYDMKELGISKIIPKTGCGPSLLLQELREYL